MEWISVESQPLIYESPTGTRYPTSHGKGRFLCAIPYMGLHEERTVWWVSFVTLNDDCSIHEIGYDEDSCEPEFLNWGGEDITHYIPEPAPPIA